MARRRYSRSSSMRFRSTNYHKSNFFEELASTFAAIEYIMEFRLRHRTVFNITMAIILVLVILIVAYFLIANHII
jgi:t-SNARE complex subunit (syntaxin)